MTAAPAAILSETEKNDDGPLFLGLLLPPSPLFCLLCAILSPPPLLPSHDKGASPPLLSPPPPSHAPSLRPPLPRSRPLAPNYVIKQRGKQKASSLLLVPHPPSPLPPLLRPRPRPYRPAPLPPPRRAEARVRFLPSRVVVARERKLALLLILLVSYTRYIHTHIYLTLPCVENTIYAYL